MAPPASPAERSPPFRGLPSDPRPAHKIPTGLRPGSSGSINARSPSSTAGPTRDADSLQYHMPLPDTSFSSPGSYPQPWNYPPAGRKFSSFRYLPDPRIHRSPPAESSSEHPLRSTSIVSTSSSTQASGLERHLTASTIATTSTLPTTYKTPHCWHHPVRESSLTE
jgi:hypothetical protein